MNRISSATRAPPAPLRLWKGLSLALVCGPWPRASGFQSDREMRAGQQAGHLPQGNSRRRWQRARDAGLTPRCRRAGRPVKALRPIPPTGLAGPRVGPFLGCPLCGHLGLAGSSGQTCPALRRAAWLSWVPPPTFPSLDSKAFTPRGLAAPSGSLPMFPRTSVPVDLVSVSASQTGGTCRYGRCGSRSWGRGWARGAQLSS